MLQPILDGVVRIRKKITQFTRTRIGAKDRRFRPLGVEQFEERCLMTSMLDIVPFPAHVAGEANDANATAFQLPLTLPRTPDASGDDVSGLNDIRDKLASGSIVPLLSNRDISSPLAAPLVTRNDGGRGSVTEGRAAWASSPYPRHRDGLIELERLPDLSDEFHVYRHNRGLFISRFYSDDLDVMSSAIMSLLELPDTPPSTGCRTIHVEAGDDLGSEPTPVILILRQGGTMTGLDNSTTYEGTLGTLRGRSDTDPFPLEGQLTRKYEPEKIRESDGLLNIDQIPTSATNPRLPTLQKPWTAFRSYDIEKQVNPVSKSAPPPVSESIDDRVIGGEIGTSTEPVGNGGRAGHYESPWLRDSRYVDLRGSRSMRTSSSDVGQAEADNLRNDSGFRVFTVWIRPADRTFDGIGSANSRDASSTRVHRSGAEARLTGSPESSSDESITISARCAKAELFELDSVLLFRERWRSRRYD